MTSPSEIAAAGPAQPPRKRRNLPFVNLMILVAGATVIGIGVWALMRKAIPILREEKEEKRPPPASAHESRDFNYRLILPQSPWIQDNQVRIPLKANLLAMRRTNPTAWFALAAQDYKTRTPRDSELKDQAISRLNSYFKNLEWEPRGEATLAGQRALRLAFQGKVGESTLAGECYIVTYKGIAYWFITWAPLQESPKLTEEFNKIRDGFSFLKERESWTETMP